IEEGVTKSLKRVFSINFPAAVGLMVLSEPIIRMIYQYGRFTSSDAEATAWALVMYSIGLVFYSSVKVLVPACYGMENTKIAVYSSVVSVACNVSLNLLLVRPFSYWGLAL